MTRELWIGGKATGEELQPMEVIDPATEEVLGRAAQAGAGDVGIAVDPQGEVADGGGRRIADR